MAALPNVCTNSSGTEHGQPQGEDLPASHHVKTPGQPGKQETRTGRPDREQGVQQSGIPGLARLSRQTRRTSLDGAEDQPHEEDADRRLDGAEGEQTPLGLLGGGRVRCDEPDSGMHREPAAEDEQDDTGGDERGYRSKDHSEDAHQGWPQGKGGLVDCSFPGERGLQHPSSN